MIFRVSKDQCRKLKKKRTKRTENIKIERIVIKFPEEYQHINIFKGAEKAKKESMKSKRMIIYDLLLLRRMTRWLP